MLKLTRKANQTIHIGNEIIITIDQISNKSVKVGIQAPNDLKIFRGEIYHILNKAISGQSDDVSHTNGNQEGYLCHQS
jgi:carbon storage regulator